MVIEKIKTYSSVITSAFAAGAILYGVFKFVDQSSASVESTKGLIDKIETIQTNQYDNSVKLDSIGDILSRVNLRTERIDIKVDKVRNQFTIHLTKDKSVTKDDLLQIINDLDVKKNTLNWWDTVGVKINIKKK